MDWELTITGVSAVAAVAAAVFAGWQACEARKSRKLADDSALDAASAQQRIADAVEKLNPPKTARWEVAHHKGDRYRLTNTGGTASLGVRITTDSFQEPETRFTRITGDSHELIWYVGQFGSTRRIQVTWHHPDDSFDEPPHEWRGLVPAKSQ